MELRPVEIVESLEIFDNRLTLLATETGYKLLAQVHGLGRRYEVADSLGIFAEIDVQPSHAGCKLQIRTARLRHETDENGFVKSGFLERQAPPGEPVKSFADLLARYAVSPSETNSVVTLYEVAPTLRPKGYHLPAADFLNWFSDTDSGLPATIGQMPNTTVNGEETAGAEQKGGDREIWTGDWVDIGEPGGGVWPSYIVFDGTLDEAIECIWRSCSNEVYVSDVNRIDDERATIILSGEHQRVKNLALSRHSQGRSVYGVGHVSLQKLNGQQTRVTFAAREEVGRMCAISLIKELLKAKNNLTQNENATEPTFTPPVFNKITQSHLESFEAALERLEYNRLVSIYGEDIAQTIIVQRYVPVARQHDVNREETAVSEKSLEFLETLYSLAGNNPETPVTLSGVFTLWREKWPHDTYYDLIGNVGELWRKKLIRMFVRHQEVMDESGISAMMETNQVITSSIYFRIRLEGVEVIQIRLNRLAQEDMVAPTRLTAKNKTYVLGQQSDQTTVTNRTGRTHNLEEGSPGIIGISSNLYRELRTVLLECGPFDTDHELEVIFVDKRLSPWRNRLPQSDNRIGRVETVINFLHYQYNDVGENVLVLLLRVLSDRLDPGNACHHRLAKLADELEREVKSGL